MAFDDLDDDFDGLEDAKEGSADDDFANISRSGLDDFNAAFDSSPPPSQAKSDSATTAAPFGVESTFDLGSLSITSAANTIGAPAAETAAAPASSGAGTQAKPTESHDWDALFASLDDTPPAPVPTSPSAKDAIADASRPAISGRALTEEGEHDDPILKNLTSMGYSRNDALSALGSMTTILRG